MRQYIRTKTFWYAAAFGLSLGLVTWKWDSQPVLANQLSQAFPVQGGLISHVQEVDGRGTRVIVIDPQLRAMGVYEISRERGEIQLKSIRKISADLQMLEFNSGEPSPADIQSRLEQR